MGSQLDTLRAEFWSEGFMIVRDVVAPQEVEILRSALDQISPTKTSRRRGATYGIRNLLTICPEVRRLAGAGALQGPVGAILGDGAFATRGILFDKTPDADWSVRWHQDTIVAVRERHTTSGFEAWSRKAGVWHVQPPSSVLSRMVTARIHLDDCDAENGALRVLPGSHAIGICDDACRTAESWETHPVTCAARAGDLLLMRPLLLHASSRTTNEARRRVIHLEYAAEELTPPLEWNDRVEADLV